MNKLSKEKRDHLILVAIGTAMAIAALWFFVITPQKEKLVDIQKRTADMVLTNQAVDFMLRRAVDIEAQLESASAELAKREATLTPERDPYGWFVPVISSFTLAHKGVNIPTIGRPETSDLAMIPKFAYKSATFTLKGSGYYHDWGRFFADFENEFPYFRLQNLEMAPLSGLSQSSTNILAADAEKLSVSFAVVTLIKPPSSTETKP